MSVPTPPARPTKRRAVLRTARYGLARIALAAARLVPARALPALGRALGLAVHALGRGPRELARANVARAMPDVPPADAHALVRACFARLGAELGRAVGSLDGRHLPRPPALDAGSAARVRDALAEGRGALFASAHLGPWEDVAARLVEEGFPFVAVARPPTEPRFAPLFSRLRDPRGVPTLLREGATAGLRVFRSLREGRLVGIPMDLKTRAPSALVPFLGGRAPTALGPARLALRARAAVLVGTVAPARDGALVVTVTRIPTDDLGDGDEDALELTKRLALELERRIRALPDAWPWMHPRFDSEGEAAGPR